MGGGREGHPPPPVRSIPGGNMPVKFKNKAQGTRTHPPTHSYTHSMPPNLPLMVHVAYSKAME